MKQPILEAKNICKKYANVSVLEQVHLTLYPGEVHALIGENGAGKSTLIKALIGIVHPDSGTVVYRGKELHISHPKEIVKYGIGIVHQELNLLPDLTVAQNILIGREPDAFVRGFINERELNRRAKEILQQFHSNLNPAAKVSDLSVAQQQMVEIAKAISYRCELLILDEPTAALTDREVETLFRIVGRLREQGVAILLVSHRMSDLRQMADRVTVLRDGKFIAEHVFSEVDTDILVQEMVGRKLTEIFPPPTRTARGEKSLSVQNLNVTGLLHDISFDAYEGEILGISGLMGAGRTELAKAIIGALPISSGEVAVRGKPLRRASPSKTVQIGIGYITEDRKRDGLFLDRDIQENIISASYGNYCRCGVIQKKRAQEDALQLKKRVNIKAFDIRQLLSSLSGGNQQKVILAKWLCRKSDILILDEPTRGIDIGSKNEIYQIMRELVRQNATLIMISSELPEILGMSDRILVMAEGWITAELSAQEATQEKIAQYSFGN